MARDSSGTSRRRFVEAVGASGARVGLTEYVDGETVGAVQQNGTTLQWVTDPDSEGEVWETLQQVNRAFNRGGNLEQAMAQIEQQLQQIEQSA